MAAAPVTRNNPSAGRLIVCEAGGAWSAGLRGELAETGLRVWECRTLSEAWEALQETPAAFLVAEATPANLDDLLRRMAWFSRDFPHARMAAVAHRSMARCEGLLREAGAVHVLVSPRRLATLARLAARHLAGVPARPQTMVERIWASLPWEPPRT